MDTIFKMKLEEAGVNFSSAMERFLNNEALYEKFLRKFTSDKSFDEFLKYMEEKNYEEAFKAAHTFKGVAGNLSLDILYERIYPLVEKLRKGEGEELGEEIEELKIEYKKICQIIDEEKEEK